MGNNGRYYAGQGRLWGGGPRGKGGPAEIGFINVVRISDTGSGGFWLQFNGHGTRNAGGLAMPASYCFGHLVIRLTDRGLLDEQCKPKSMA